MTQFEQIVNQPFLYVNGLQIFPGSQEVFLVHAGQCRDESNQFDIISSGTITADLKTNGLNGLDQGALADSTSYDVYLIRDTSGYLPVGTITCVTGTSPLMPSDNQGNLYSVKRRIGYILTDGSANVIPYLMYGNNNEKSVFYDSTITALTGGAATSFATVSLIGFMPNRPGMTVLLGGLTSAGITALARRTGSSATAPSWRIQGTTAMGIGNQAFITGVNNLNQPALDYEVSGGNVNLWIGGYLDSL